MNPSEIHPVWLPALLGVITHVFVRHYEPRSISGFAAVLLAPPSLCTVLLGLNSFLGVLSTFAVSIGIHLLALATSIVVYRLSPLHPLANYPGPRAARLSRFWQTRSALSGKQHEKALELFQRYGDVVRSGPNHLLIRDVEAVAPVLGARNSWWKGECYDFVRAHLGISPCSVFLIRSPSEHTPRRRLWDRAFAPPALKEYEPMFNARLGQLVSSLESRLGSEVDIAEAFFTMTLSFIGDLSLHGVLGDDPAVLRKIMQQTRRSNSGLNVILTLPWARPFLHSGLMTEDSTEELGNRLVKAAVTRRATAGGGHTHDVISYLIEADSVGEKRLLNTPLLEWETSLTIGAGWDTTGTALSNALFHLITQPTIFVKLRKELDHAAGIGATYDIAIENSRLAELSFLQAVINETLRLYPAVPSGTQRSPPPGCGPIIVAGHVIPPGTTVQIPTYSIHRDERYFFPRTQEFWPERWTSEGEADAATRSEAFRLVHAAYMPFSFGSWNCVGKGLAILELRKTLAALVRRFDFRLGDTFDKKEWDAEAKDHFSLTCGRLPVVISERV